jgi:hypothetical protein
MQQLGVITVLTRTLPTREAASVPESYHVWQTACLGVLVQPRFAATADALSQT